MTDAAVRLRPFRAEDLEWTTFTTTTVHRLWVWTELENLAEQRALERCRFEREGVLRRGSWRGGAWRDVYMYGRLPKS